MSEQQVPTGRPRMNRAEAMFCFVTLGVFSAMAMLMGIAGRERGPALQATVMSLFATLLALLPVGLALEIAYRRRAVHGAVLFCLLVTVFMWIMLACMLFPDGG